MCFVCALQYIWAWLLGMFDWWLTLLCFLFFFKQKTAYEMRISDWSSDVCSSDLFLYDGSPQARAFQDVRLINGSHFVFAGLRGLKRFVRDSFEDRKSVV